MRNALVVMVVAVTESEADLVAVLGTLKHTLQEVSMARPEVYDCDCMSARKGQTFPKSHRSECGRLCEHQFWESRPLLPVGLGGRNC